MALGLEGRGLVNITALGTSRFVSVTQSVSVSRVWFQSSFSLDLETRRLGSVSTPSRVGGVEGSCAKRLTMEFYTVVMLRTFILIIISIPSPLTLSSQA